MNTLAGRLMLAFAGVILVAGVLTVVLVSRSASSEMRRVMVVTGGQMRMVDAATLRDSLAESYRRTGSWDHAGALLDESGAHMRMMGGDVALLGPDGSVLAGNVPTGSRAASDRSELPIVVDGARVAVLLVRDMPDMMGSAPPLDVAVARVSRAAWLAAMVAGLLAFALAWLLVRNVSRPLAKLAGAARSVARGELGVRAPVGGPAEVRGVAESFNSMAETLAHQEDLRRAMLSDVAHELRTPLAVIQAQAEALQDGILPPTPPNLAPLVNQSKQLVRVVEDLRTLAHADAGQLQLEVTAVPLAPLVAEVLSGLAGEAAAHGVTTVGAVPSDLPDLRADPVRLWQVLANLLSNALRHTPAGGSVVVTAARCHDMAEITVRDDGAGVPPEDLPHVFERFYRVEKSRSRDTGGSGLGLAIARRLVEAHGGRIRLESRLGAGTVVTFSCPLYDGRTGAG